MSKVTQSFSQLMTTFGPGAMMDMPDHAVMVSGLSDWDWAGSVEIIEPRLLTLLREQLAEQNPHPKFHLRTPPLHDDDLHKKDPTGIGARIFPQWFLLGLAETKGRETRREMRQFARLTTSAGKLKAEIDGKKVDVTPVRFVAACPRGHIEDIDWRQMAHGGKTNCRRTLKWVERGVSADPASISVRCDCGEGISLSDLFKPGRLGSCNAQAPWLDSPPENYRKCISKKDGKVEMLKLLSRSATNTYFSQTVSIISMPAEGNLLTQLVGDHWDSIKSFAAQPDLAVSVIRGVPAMAQPFEPFGDGEISAAISSRAKGVETGKAQNPKLVEYQRLSSGEDTIGSDRAGSHLFAQTLARMSDQPDIIESVVQVHRLREVSCLYGFTRLEPSPTASENALEEIELPVDGAPLDHALNWLPAGERFGEGVFLKLDGKILQSWASSDAVKHRARELQAGERLDAIKRGQEPTHLGVTYYALHSFSHALMAQLALQCGYPLSSLKERIYASDAQETLAYGLLIYTANAGGQGTLGGLSNIAKRIGPIIDETFEALSICSNDPICSEHLPTSTEDDRPLHGAVCHSCLLVPETSCEARNGRLDRALLVPTLTDIDYALIKNRVSSI